MLPQHKKQKPEILATLSKTENEIVQAHYSSKCIKEYTAEDFKAFDKFLLTLSKFTGIDPVPDEDTRDAMMAFMVENFGLFTLPEIKKAFNMALAFKLDMPNSEVHNYNRLSAQWIGGVLNAYQNKRNETLMKHHRESNKNIQEPEVTQEQIDEKIKQGIIEAYDNYVYNPEEEIIDVKNVMYRYLERKNIIQLDDVEKTKLMDSAMRNLREKYSQEKAKSDVIKAMEISTKIEALKQDRSPVRSEARRLAIQQFFYKLLTEHKHIKELL